MRCLLDIDHLSLLQRQTGVPYSMLSASMARRSLSDFAVSTITFCEQLLGASQMKGEILWNIQVSLEFWDS
jgi:tRNA(fMet)-specific endonuclease VapC